MITSDVIALSALLLSVFSMIGSAIVYISGLRRERRTATLNAFNVLQEQVLDHLNLYTRKRVEEISASPRSEEYKLLSGYLARLEHFAVGINTGIYDVQVVKRLAGLVFMRLAGQDRPSDPEKTPAQPNCKAL